MEFPPPERRKKYPSQCNLCRGSITEQRVTLPYMDRDGTLKLVRGAPAGVCQQCHERYLSSDTAAAIDELLTSPPTKEETVSVWEFVKVG